MTPPTAFAFARQRIIVADEDSPAVTFIVDTLQRDGHLVTRATDVLCAAEDLALRECHLVISSMRVNGVRQVDAIAELHEHLPALRSFILNGGTPAAAHLHVARTVVRRAERAAWAAWSEHSETMNPLAITYLNRLSDLLFILARYANRENGDVLWVPGGERG